MRSLKWILFCTLFSGLTLSSDASAQQLATANAYPANSILETATSKAPADAPSAATLPTTKELLTRNDEVMGGAAAWSKVTTRKIKGIYQTEDLSPIRRSCAGEPRSRHAIYRSRQSNFVASYRKSYGNSTNR
jgi:hypothetical protein